MSSPLPLAIRFFAPAYGDQLLLLSLQEIFLNTPVIVKTPEQSFSLVVIDVSSEESGWIDLYIVAQEEMELGSVTLLKGNKYILEVSHILHTTYLHKVRMYGA